MATLAAAFDKALDTTQGEQSQDQAPAPVEQAKPADATPPPEEKGPEAAPAQEPSDELLPQEEWDKLQNDPKALRKALNTRFTEKTQELAEQRKQLEPWMGFKEAYEADPQGTVRKLASQIGLNVADVETKAEAKSAANEMVDELKASLGPELEFLADKIGPALEKVVLKMATNVVSKEVEPLKQQAEQAKLEAVQTEVNTSIDSFTKKHPEWKKHEAKMTEIGEWFQPAADPKTGKSPTTEQYMEALYTLATKDVNEAEIIKKHNERMKSSAEKSETPGGGVAPSRVAQAAPKFNSLNDALKHSWEAALDGKSYE